MPVEQIIQKFAQREEEFRKERDNFTYTQMFVIQTIDMDGQPDGEHRMTSDILFTPAGKRSEEHTSELQSLAYLVCRLLLEKKKKKATMRRQMNPAQSSCTLL